MSGQPLLQVRDLQVHYGARTRRQRPVRAVDGVSFDLWEGEALGLVGESGCGKSTLARALVRLVDPTSGVIVFQGRDITDARGRALRQLRRQLRIVFQDPYASLNPRRTVAENVARPLRIQGVYRQMGGRTRVLELLELVGLGPELAGRLPRQLSGGQRQRVGIARALALDPRLIVLDEPVSSLDSSVRAQVLELLARLRRELGVAYLFIGHDLSAVRQVSDRIAVMYLGQIVELGPRDVVFTQPQHPYTRALLSAVPVPDPAAARTRNRIVLTGELPDPSDPPSGCRFRTRCWKADAQCETVPPRAGTATRWAACHYPG